MSLLQRAKRVKPNEFTREFNDEDLELALAWARDEIGMRQVMVVKKFGSTGRVYVFLARTLRQVIQRKLKIDSIPEIRSQKHRVISN